jgi:chromosome segregation ATPase
MEITLSEIISLVGLLVGGSSIGGFLFWRQTKRRAKAEASLAEAEAKLKEAEAKSAEVDMAQKVQDTYQEILEYKQKEVEDNHRLISELREDRDHYKKGYTEIRDELEKLTKEFYEFKRNTENERQKMKSDILRNTRMAESSRPFMCALAQECSKCVPVIISEDGEVEKPHQIEPINSEDM